VVVGGCVSVPIFEHHVPSSNALGVVSACHKLGRGDVAAGQEGGVEEEGKMSEAFLEGANKVG